MKVKFFRGFDTQANFTSGHTVYPLEDLINEFIKDKKVIDIKYQLYKQAGNAVTVPVIKKIAEQFKLED